MYCKKTWDPIPWIATLRGVSGVKLADKKEPD